MKHVTWVALCLGLAVVPGTARGLQPLDAFVASACREGLDAREARLLEESADARTRTARARLLPSLRASAGYTRNSEEVRVSQPGMTPGEQVEIVMTPRDQLDASVGVSVPLVDVAAWNALEESALAADAQRERTSGALSELVLDVTRAYYALAAAEAVQAAATRKLHTAERDVQYVSTRREAGLATDLELARARTDLLRARQEVLEAELSLGIARRALETISRLRPEPGFDPALPASGADAPAPLARWLVGTDALPSVRAAELDARAADAAHAQAWTALLPTIAGTADYRATNAAGFGSATSWAAGLTATWALGFGHPASIAQADSARAVAEVRRERAERAARDGITESWLRVRALQVRVEASRAEQDQAADAARLARARYQAGRALQLDVVAAERDAFGAEVRAIQASADLAVAEAELRVRAGRVSGCE